MLRTRLATVAILFTGAAFGCAQWQDEALLKLKNDDDAFLPSSANVEYIVRARGQIVPRFTSRDKVIFYADQGLSRESELQNGPSSTVQKTASISFPDVYLQLNPDSLVIHSTKDDPISGQTGQLLNSWIPTQPILAVGRGLSNLTKQKIEGTPQHPIFFGSYVDGTVFRASLDPSHGLVPTKIERLKKNSDEAGQTWVIKGFAESNGIYYSSDTIRSGGTFNTEFKYHAIVIGHRIANPNPTPWFAKGMHVMDCRVSPPVFYTHEELANLGSPPTLAMILKASQERSPKLASQISTHTQVDQRPNPNDTVKIIVLWTVLLGGLTAMLVSAVKMNWIRIA